MSTQLPETVWSVLIGYSFLRNTHRYRYDSEQMIVSIIIGVAFTMFFISFCLYPMDTTSTSILSLGLMILGGVCGYLYECKNVNMERARLTNYIYRKYYKTWLALRQAKSADEATTAVDESLFKIKKVIDRLI